MNVRCELTRWICLVFRAQLEPVVATCKTRNDLDLFTFRLRLWVRSKPQTIPSYVDPVKQKQTLQENQSGYALTWISPNLIRIRKIGGVSPA